MNPSKSPGIAAPQNCSFVYSIFLIKCTTLAHFGIDKAKKKTLYLPATQEAAGQEKRLDRCKTHQQRGGVQWLEKAAGWKNDTMCELWHYLVLQLKGDLMPVDVCTVSQQISKLAFAIVQADYVSLLED